MTIIPGATKGMKFPPEPLTISECQSLLSGAVLYCTPAWTAPRLQAAIVLMWRGGLRAAEALALRARDIDYEHGVLRVRHGKGGLADTIALDPDAMRVLAAWQHERDERGAEQDGQWLRVPGKHKDWTYHDLNSAVKRLAKRAGITKRVSCHQFRHSMAAHMADEQMDLRIIQRQLRHTSLDTTYRYVNHLNPTALTAAISQRPGFLEDDE